MPSANRNQFGHDTPADEVLEGINLSGKLAFITGGSTGLGAETARALAVRGSDVVITGRDIPKAEKVAENIRASTGRSVEVIKLELDSLESVKACAAKFLEKHSKLDILINNAGVMACPQAKTKEGFELQFGANHLGHFLLTNLLTPALVSGAPSRIVCLSSSAHHVSPVVFEDVNFEKRPYHKWASYGQAKTANALHAVELQKRLGSKGVTCFSVHPGAIQTELSRHLEEEDIKMFTDRVKAGTMKVKTIPAGAATSCYAATAPELEGKGGVFLENCGISQTADKQSEIPGQCDVRPYALDTEGAAKLWAMSEELIKKFL